ncbi:putative protein N(5)-glutamine methyltransferase [Nocardioides sp. CFH 31398]|uniref:putative protein N(5)-glutamine methyltransferase n=1 Tax=Nocardioides sp. CFH 31398 TaxID=2919579 RepID=UPI001F06466E|nr:putative protein N(5)-glutamine methyltransferase [Nocardioides sp. CFH 31398]MCH1866362.1 putative protein N(5)-glutamine methyltransferase [Nocardioides sp. CFH 31398]
MPSDTLVATLRAAGCVFAEEEAALLQEAAGDDAALAGLVARRVAGEPLEQVVGFVDLGGLRLRVAPGCFVPRQRTMLLVREAVAAARAAGPGAVVVEAYAGVAPVAAHVAVAVPDARLYAVERDERVLGAARANGGGRVSVHHGDVLDGLPPAVAGRVAVVAAVPPYVPDDDLALMPREAREHEAPSALLGGPDGLGPFRALVEAASGWLAPGGVVLAEVSVGQAPSAIAAAQTLGYAATAVTEEATAVVRVVR